MKKDFRFSGERPDDIFEAITVMATRARQINQKRSEDYPIQNMNDAESEEPVVNDIDFSALEKPASIAMEEYEKGEIQYKYRDSDPVTEPQK
ncbi:MAG: DNA-directed RNA polymerase subunit omega [Candidatus Neomarinimicrobiota bacterium]|jgi:DNA-directed RNA polymerase subunit K/omega|nr:DNA-directed RNA polymerase subunit omega [Candidatus Neomarinimicrobiota bacterium]MDD3966658.1 DNA-directed RNA polymerase subunit omega [Candidatus Neomarinimicrobiota bacterium]MDX9780301.1 DNA-directed RNA polymerase subunit omega [bacterium]